MILRAYLLIGLLFAGPALLSVDLHAGEKPIRARGPNGPLEGTLRSSDDPASPIVVIIPGSGPTDRDGNNPQGLAASTYRLLAHDLAAAGLSSIRFDKRGMFGSHAAVPDANDVTLSDYAEDVHSWVRVARKESGRECAWLLGHSEGGLVALLAARNSGSICGLVLMASPGRPFGEVLKQQLRENPANASLLSEAMEAIDALEAGRRVDVSDLDPALQRLFAPQVQRFLSSLMSVDPAKLISGVSVPVLIVQGERDLQVSARDALRLREARPGAHLALLPKTNHVFKRVEQDNRATNFATYSDSSLPLAPGVTDAIVDFVNSR